MGMDEYMDTELTDAKVRPDIYLVCTANISRSRMGAAIIQNMKSKHGINKIIVNSGGTLVDTIEEWKTWRYLDFQTNIKMIKIAHNSGLDKVAGYEKKVEEILSNQDEYRYRFDSDKNIKDDINRVGRHLYSILEPLDLSATITACTIKNTPSSLDLPKQFNLNGSKFYVAMDKKNYDKLLLQIQRESSNTYTGKPFENYNELLCIDDFIPGKTMQSSLKNIAYSNGKLDITKHLDMYDTIEEGCHNILEYIKAKI